MPLTVQNGQVGRALTVNDWDTVIECVGTGTDVFTIDEPALAGQTGKYIKLLPRFGSVQLRPTQNSWSAAAAVREWNDPDSVFSDLDIDQFSLSVSAAPKRCLFAMGMLTLQNIQHLASLGLEVDGTFYQSLVPLTNMGATTGAERVMFFCAIPLGSPSVGTTKVVRIKVGAKASGNPGVINAYWFWVLGQNVNQVQPYTAPLLHQHPGAAVSVSSLTLTCQAVEVPTGMFATANRLGPKVAGQTATGGIWANDEVGLVDARKTGYAITGVDILAPGPGSLTFGWGSGVTAKPGYVAFCVNPDGNVVEVDTSATSLVSSRPKQPITLFCTGPNRIRVEVA